MFERNKYYLSGIACLMLLLISLGQARAHELDFVPDPQNPAHYPSAYDPDGDGQLMPPMLRYNVERYDQVKSMARRHVDELAHHVSLVQKDANAHCAEFLRRSEWLRLSPQFIEIPPSHHAQVDLLNSQSKAVYMGAMPMVSACWGDKVIGASMVDQVMGAINAFKSSMNDLAPVAQQTAGSVVGNGSAGSCTEAALQAVVANGGTVTFNCGGEITIPVTKRIQITKDTVIDGDELVTLDGQNRSAILGSEQRLTVGLKDLKIVNGFSAEQGAGVNMGFWNDLTIDRVTFDNNVSTAEAALCDGGGALFIGGGSTALVERSLFRNNKAANGGAINNLRTKLTIHMTTFINNSAIHTPAIGAKGECGGGGAIYFDGTRKPEDGGPDPVVWQNVQFIENTTNNHGGAVFFGIRSGEKVTIADVLFRGNKATRVSFENQSGTGGAFWLGPGVGGQTGYRFHMDRVAFIENHADFQGGGLWTRSATELTNVTFAGNTAINPAISDRGNWRRGFGGAVVAGDRAELLMNHVTVVNNRSGFNGGGVSGENVHASNTIVANNVGEWDTGLQQNCTHHIKSRGANIQYLFGHQPENHAHNSNCGSAFKVVNPAIGPVGVNGGALPTAPLMPSSAAIDAGSAASCLSVDQRMMKRPSGSTCDIGAYELQQ